DQCGAEIRSREGERVPARHSRRHRGALRARSDSEGLACPLRGEARDPRIPRQGRGSALMPKLSRSAYAAMYGPTTGDRVRLADTDLFIEVEDDRTIYGEEVKFGGGKVIRDGMGQSQVTRAEGALDTVITNALILDHTGIFKADVGLRDGRIAAIGNAGNPDTQPGVTLIIGPSTEIIAGE